MERQTMKHQVKYLTRILSNSSQRFFSAFLDDSLIIKKEQEKIKNQLIHAASLKVTTVLQVSESINEPVETLYGQIELQPLNETIILLNEEKNNTLRMLPIHMIRKVSFIESSHSKIS